MTAAQGAAQRAVDPHTGRGGSKAPEHAVTTCEPEQCQAPAGMRVCWE